MALERKFGQWSCQVSPDEPVVFQVSGHDIVVTNVSLGPKLRGDARSTLLIHHVNAQRQGDEVQTQAAAVACLTPGKASNSRPSYSPEQVALEVRGENDVHLFGHYVAYHKTLPASASSPSTGAVRPQARQSRGTSAHPRQQAAFVFPDSQPSPRTFKAQDGT
ncbi:hypothetical protein B0H10DRAFT_2238512 [Mycena sp. CBHHK59/15]|nr:hypothetical protein B0H10DRAFT_2238512 [Mycena sp. CBHHK59/15]